MTDPQKGKERLAEIAAGLDGITEGEWGLSGVRYRMNGGEWQNVTDPSGMAFCVISIDPRTLAGLQDGKHIARCSKAAFLDILAYVDSLKEENERLKEVIRASGVSFVCAKCRAPKRGLPAVNDVGTPYCSKDCFDDRALAKEQG